MDPSNLKLTDEEKQTVVDLAYSSVKYGIEHESCMVISPTDYSENLQKTIATFVTLKRHGDLLGCIGVIEAFRPLAEDIVRNAFAAAFFDSRFSPLQESQLSNLDIHISLLSPPENIEFSSQEELLEKMRPGVDGLVLEEPGFKGCFLPVMWDRLQTSEQFLRQLKVKAGLTTDYWSNTVQVWRFTAQSIPE